MTESRVGVDENPTVKMARGCAFLTPADAKILRLRAKTHKQTVSATIQELSKVIIDKVNTEGEEARNKIISRYHQQSIERMGTGLETFQKTSQPSYVEVYWVLPKEFVEKLGGLASRKISMESLLNGLLTDAINMKSFS